MSPGRDEKDVELRRLHSQADAREDDIRDMGAHEHRQDTLIGRLRREAEVRDDELSETRLRLAEAEHELEDLRAIRDALTPSELPERPGLELAAAFVPATEQVSGDFYLVAEGPQDSTVLVIGDVVGHGLQAARRAAFVRTAFVATAPFTDDPWRLLSWVNTALVERAGPSADFVTAACMTYLPRERLLRFAYAGHPPALCMPGGRELLAPIQGVPLGVHIEPEYDEGQLTAEGPMGVLLYTDGLTEVRHNGSFFGLDGVTAVLGELERPSALDVVSSLRARVAAFADADDSPDDLCMLAAFID
jgi:serine phosphatase RsbU (regulator of sigma subunit)